jgi:predicted nuclease of restriction endonuclease-like (RecB) superfamily
LREHDPEVVEFLGLKPQDVMGESHLEDQLLDKLCDFLLELGHGFSFEARQKRILIGDTHNLVDLVFYHRVLKCHVLVAQLFNLTQLHRRRAVQQGRARTVQRASRRDPRGDPAARRDG